MVAAKTPKERLLLVTVQRTDDSGGSSDGSLLPKTSLVHAIRAAGVRQLGADPDADDAEATSAAAHVRFYAPDAHACLVRVPLARSRLFRAAIPRVRFVNQQPVRLTVVRAFGNVVLARRALAALIERQLALADGTGQARMRRLLSELSELLHKR